MSNFKPYEYWHGPLLVTIFYFTKYILNLWRTLFCQLLYFSAPSYKKKLIKSDFGSFRNMLRLLIFFKYWRNLFYHRIGAISIPFTWLLPPDQNIIIPFRTKIGMHAEMIHNYGSHLNAESIGDNFRCYQHVVLGNSNVGDGRRPRIGSNVVCATGVVIVGDITIGNNVKIAANSFVNRSIPDNCTVMGNPAFIVKRDGIKTNIPL